MVDSKMIKLTLMNPKLIFNRINTITVLSYKQLTRVRPGYNYNVKRFEVPIVETWVAQR